MCAPFSVRVAWLPAPRRLWQEPQPPIRTRTFRLDPASSRRWAFSTLKDLPQGLTPAGPPESSVGPRSLLDNATDGSSGHADQYFQKNGGVGALSQFAEEVTDYGTVASAKRWMLGQKVSNQPNDIPMYGNGVEVTPEIPVMTVGGVRFVGRYFSAA